MAISFAVVFNHFAAAGKPGGGGGGTPAPPGTIYFSLSPQNSVSWSAWSMNGSGGSKMSAEGLGIDRNSSHKVYGTGYRWIPCGRLSGPQEGQVSPPQYDRVLDGNGEEVLDGQGNPVIIPQSDLFASAQTNDGLVEIQLPDFFGNVMADTHPNYGDFFYRWSKDDTFISFKGWDVSEAVTIEVDGTRTLDSRMLKEVIVRVWIGGDEVEAYFTPIEWGDPRAEIVVSSTHGYEGNFKHDWSPDGTKIAYVLDPVPTLSFNEDLFVSDISAGPAHVDGDVWSDNVQLVWDGDAHIFDPLWQPVSGYQVAFSYKGFIYTAKPDGTVGTLVAGSGPAWSPDGTSLVYVTTQQKGLTYYRYIDRITVATEKVVRLTSDLDPKLRKAVTGWFLP